MRALHSLYLGHSLTTCVDPTQYTIIQEVMKDGPSSPIAMFSAVYKFTYRSKESEWLHSPALSSAPSSSSDETSTPCRIQPSVPFDTLLPIEPTSFTEYDDLDAYFDFNSMDVKPNWELHSPSEIFNDVYGYEQFQSCGGDQFHVFDRLSVPPPEGCLTDLYNYVSHIPCAWLCGLSLTSRISRTYNICVCKGWRSATVGIVSSSESCLRTCRFHSCLLPCEGLSNYLAHSHLNRPFQILYF